MDAESGQRQRKRWVLPMAASYGVDTLFLGLYAAFGSIPGNVPLAYGAAAALICLLALFVYSRGWNLALGNPDMAEPLIVLGVLMQLAVVAAAPQITFPYLANLFTVFAFGMVSMSVRASVRVWTLQVLASALVLYLAGERAGSATRSTIELFLSWAYFALILARCLMLSVNANLMRKRLNESRSLLATSLEQVKELATHDELTQIPNRRALLARLEQERGRAERAGTPFSIAMLDLDHFKAVNDAHGHAAGDAVLQKFALTVLEHMRATDVFGRYGGEEFMLILVGAAPAAALEGTERIRSAVAARDWNAVVPGLALTVSAGVATFRKGESGEALVARADAALYEAKRAGRNRVAVGDA
jgi:diguanylate cyclase (GGDEF)-like protein